MGYYRTETPKTRRKLVRRPLFTAKENIPLNKENLDDKLIATPLLFRFTEFSNLRLCVYTPYAHDISNQSLIENKDTTYTKCYKYIHTRVHTLIKSV